MYDRLCKYTHSCATTSVYAGALKTLGANKDLALPIKLFELSDVVFLAPDKEVGSQNQRQLVAVQCSKESGFEVIHGLLNRVMEVLGIPLRQGQEKHAIRNHLGIAFKPCSPWYGENSQKQANRKTANGGNIIVSSVPLCQGANNVICRSEGTMHLQGALFASKHMLVAVQTTLVKMILTTGNLQSSIQMVATAGGLLLMDMMPTSLAVKPMSFCKQAPALPINHLRSG